MNKYIDAEKLIAEIHKHIGKYDSMLHEWSIPALQGKREEAFSILTIVESLQQEQPNNLVDVDAVREDFITEVYRVLYADSTSDRANAIIDAFDSLPTVSQEQPKVDLEKEIDNFLNETGAPYVWCNDDEQKEWCNIIAHHFYELGLNARK